MPNNYKFLIFKIKIKNSSNGYRKITFTFNFRQKFNAGLSCKI